MNYISSVSPDLPSKGFASRTAVAVAVNCSLALFRSFRLDSWPIDASDKLERQRVLASRHNFRKKREPAIFVPAKLIDLPSIGFRCFAKDDHCTYIQN